MKLIRLDDGLEIEFDKIEYVEFDENGRGTKSHKEPAEGRSCILNLGTQESAIAGKLLKMPYFKWQTTTIKKVISNTEWKTLNSHYKIEE